MLLDSDICGPSYTVAANNPAFQQQIQQQRLQQLAQQQQQQQRQLLAQQATYGNMGNMPMGVPMQPMGPNQAAQMAAMRSRMPVGSYPASGSPQKPRTRLVVF